jgi:hypothetical protein
MKSTLTTAILLAASSLLTGWCADQKPAPAPQKPIPTLRLLPEDVEQDSIRQFSGPQTRDMTNNFIVRWTYTEAGARKMLDFKEAHWGEKVRTVIGSFQSPLGEHVFIPMPPHFTNYTQWKEGWLKWRTDKFFFVSESDAALSCITYYDQTNIYPNRR